MGNHFSFCNSGSFVSWVIFPTGEVRRLRQKAKAAELMMEMPNFFLVNVKSLRIGRRLSPLNADEDLEMNGVYLYFPM
ncbi:hypothetical protein M569_14993, partial [Genlisea aurea]